MKIGPKNESAIVGTNKLPNDIAWYPHTLFGMTKAGFHIVLNNGPN
jgi:hypothetical protein